MTLLLPAGGLDAHSGATTHSLMWAQGLGTHREELCEKGVLKGETDFSWGSHHLLGVPKAKAMERGHAGAVNGCGSHGRVWLQGHRWAAPTYLPKNPGSEILLIAVFLSSAPKRRSGIPRQPAWACRGSRIPVLGCISCTDTSKQRFLPTQAMEAANNPGMPRLCTAQLSASCLFLGGCSATGREHFLAIIKKRNCADRSS